MKVIAGILLAVSVVVAGGLGAFAFQRSMEFDDHCGTYLKRAGTAPTIPLAEENLRAAIAYLDAHHLTAGHTYNAPGGDIGYFYRSLTESERTLEEVPANADALTVSNVLLRLHDGLQGQDKNGATANIPDGISLHPHAGGIIRGLVLAVVVAIGAGCWLYYLVR